MIHFQWNSIGKKIRRFEKKTKKEKEKEMKFIIIRVILKKNYINIT